MIINKALVHKGSTPLVQMFFSDVSKITMFQSLNAFTGKITGNNSSHKSRTKHEWRFCYLFQTDDRAKGFYVLLWMPLFQTSLLLCRMNLSSVQKFKLCLPLPW